MGNLERFVQDDGRTMRNLLGVRRDPDLFERKMSDRTAERLSELREDPSLIPRTFDRAHLSALHHHITQDVFEWAGRMRDETVTIEGEKIGPVKTMAKPGGKQFDDDKDIRPGFNVLKKLVDPDAARKMGHKDFADHAAKIFTHLNWMHPFREGNGRVNREFITSYAEETGHSLDFSQTNQGRMYEVSEHSVRGHHSHMRRFFEEISDPQSVDRMRGPYGAYRKVEGFQQLYFAHAYPGHPVKGTLRGAGRGEFVVQDENTKQITVAAINDLPRGAQAGDPLHFVPQTGPTSVADKTAVKNAVHSR